MKRNPEVGDIVKIRGRGHHERLVVKTTKEGNPASPIVRFDTILRDHADDKKVNPPVTTFWCHQTGNAGGGTNVLMDDITLLAHSTVKEVVTTVYSYKEL